MSYHAELDHIHEPIPRLNYQWAKWPLWTPYIRFHISRPYLLSTVFHEVSLTLHRGHFWGGRHSHWISHLTQYICTQQESKLNSRIHLLQTVFSWVSLFLSHGPLAALWGGPRSLPYSLLLNCITDTTLTWWLYCFSRVVSSLSKELLPLDTLHKYINLKKGHGYGAILKSTLLH